MKCWDFNAENRPSAKELYQILKKWNQEDEKSDSEIRSQMSEYYEKIREKKLKNRSNENKSENYIPSVSENLKFGSVNHNYLSPITLIKQSADEKSANKQPAVEQPISICSRMYDCSCKN
uniref:Serine-threonine/tyrosine-protein kinase catalytic domain-containing protein n=1 Tax=Rhizophagus irregularis (strain DAOM 181602 / DAOM 197198 / MUCL 43194) TaxID=747089 RepID=U9U241_RHIID